MTATAFHPKFNELCVAARDKGLDVELVAGDHLHRVKGPGDTTVEYRDIVAVRLTPRANPKGKARATSQATLSTLDKAAQSLMWAVS